MTLVGHDPTNSALRGRQLYQFVHRAIWYSQGDSNPCLRRERPTTWPTCPWEHTFGQFIQWCPALSLFGVVSDMRLELIRLETEHFECSVSAIPPIRDIKHNLHWASLTHSPYLSQPSAMFDFIGTSHTQLYGLPTTQLSALYSILLSSTNFVLDLL